MRSSLNACHSLDYGLWYHLLLISPRRKKWLQSSYNRVRDYFEQKNYDFVCLGWNTKWFSFQHGLNSLLCYSLSAKFHKRWHFVHKILYITCSMKVCYCETRAYRSWSYSITIIIFIKGLNYFLTLEKFNDNVKNMN